MFSLAEYHTASTSEKSEADLSRLTSLLTDPAFRCEDLRADTWQKIDRQREARDNENPFHQSCGWRSSDIKIAVSKGQKGAKT